MGPRSGLSPSLCTGFVGVSIGKGFGAQSGVSSVGSIIRSLSKSTIIGSGEGWRDGDAGVGFLGGKICKVNLHQRN